MTDLFKNSTSNVHELRFSVELHDEGTDEEQVCYHAGAYDADGYGDGSGDERSIVGWSAFSLKQLFKCIQNSYRRDDAEPEERLLTVDEYLKKEQADRVWSATVPGIGALVECFRSVRWKNDKLVVTWPSSGEKELFEDLGRKFSRGAR